LGWKEQLVITNEHPAHIYPFINSVQLLIRQKVVLHGPPFALFKYLPKTFHTVNSCTFIIEANQLGMVFITRDFLIQTMSDSKTVRNSKKEENSMSNSKEEEFSP
jgi:hypothetical protein